MQAYAHAILFVTTIAIPIDYNFCFISVNNNMSYINTLNFLAIFWNNFWQQINRFYTNSIIVYSCLYKIQTVECWVQLPLECDFCLAELRKNANFASLLIRMFYLRLNNFFTHKIWVPNRTRYNRHQAKNELFFFFFDETFMVVNLVFWPLDAHNFPV